MIRQGVAAGGYGRRWGAPQHHPDSYATRRISFPSNL